MTDYGFLMTSVASRDDAGMLANALVAEKLAACVQILPVESVYVWDGETRNEPEILLLVKTRAELFEPAMARIRKLHPYTVPEIVATRFTAGLPAYFSWIDTVTRPA